MKVAQKKRTIINGKASDMRPSKMEVCLIWNRSHGATGSAAHQLALLLLHRTEMIQTQKSSTCGIDIWFTRPNADFLGWCVRSLQLISSHVPLTTTWFPKCCFLEKVKNLLFSLISSYFQVFISTLLPLQRKTLTNAMLEPSNDGSRIFWLSKMVVLSNDSMN